MKATLDFNLPEDRADFERASRAVDWYLIAHDMDEFLRHRLKCGDLDSAFVELQAARDELHAILELRDLTLEE